MMRRLDAGLAASLLANSELEYVLFDIDGVLWTGSTVVPGAPEALELFRRHGKKLRFVSNNASVSRKGLMQNFTKHHIGGVSESEMYNSAYASALRLQQLLGRADPADAEGGGEKKVHGNVFVVGEAGLHEELQKVLAPGFITYGLELHDAEKVGGFDGQLMATAWRERVMPAPLQRLVVCDGSTCRALQATGNPEADKDNRISLADLNPVAVVAGLDKHFNMVKLAYAGLAIQGPPASLRAAHAKEHGRELSQSLFIATNEDPQIPVGVDVALLPGAGCMVSALSVCCGRRPDAVCGKPEPDMARVLFKAEGITDPARQCLMIGDRLTTDVAFGNAAGCQSMLVLSGAEGVADVEAATAAGKKELLPTYIADSLASFLPQ